MAITKEQATKDGMIGGCPLIGDKEKLDFDSIVGQEITVDEFMSTKTKDGDAYVITFAEYPTHYAWAGGFLSSMIAQYGDDFIGTVLKVGEKVKTNNKRDYRVFDIL